MRPERHARPARVRRQSARRAGTARSLAAAVSLVLLLGACTGGDDGDDRDDEGPGEPGTSRAAEPLPTTARIGELTGRLPVPRRRQVLAGVVEVVDGWLDAAYVGGDYPRSDFAKAWPGFTADARRQARGDAALTSNARIGERVESAWATRRRVVVDVLAVDGRAVGATARIDLRLRLEGDLDRSDQVRGRLLLTPAGKGWTVFGYDLTRGRVVPRAGGDGKKDGKQGGGRDGKQGKKQDGGKGGAAGEGA